MRNDGRLVMVTTVAGQKYEAGESKVIYSGGSHFSTDLATRKYISYAFQTRTFRK